ncbi:MAG: cell wall hydrolase [Janthinobacterium lividum]
MINNISKSDINILARTIYGEARGDYNRPDGGLSSLISVANVVINRFYRPHQFGATIQEICLKPYQFSCWNKKDSNADVISLSTILKNPLFDLCLDVAENTSYKKWPDLTKGSDHYYATWMTKIPYWAQGLKPKITIGQHHFFHVIKGE